MEICHFNLKKMENTQLTNELAGNILNNYILNATAKGVDVVNALECITYLLNKARIYDELKKQEKNDHDN